MNKSALWEAVKEPLRLIVIAIVAGLISWIAIQGWDPTAIALITIVLRAVDKMLHDYGKESGNTTLEGGLTRF